MKEVKRGRVKKILSYGLDSIVVTSGSNFFYLTGLKIETFERPLLLFMSEDYSFLLAPKLEMERLGDLNVTESLFYDDATDPFKIIESTPTLKNILRKGVKIGVDPNLRFSFFYKLNNIFKDVNFVDASEEIQLARMIKEEEEIKNIEKASNILSKIFETAQESISPGISEAEVRFNLMKKASELGASSYDFIAIQSGENTAIPHHEFSSRKIRRGDLIVIDVVVSYNWYNADLTRVFSLGKPNEEVLSIYSFVRQAQKIGIESSISNVTAKSIDEKVRNYFKEREIDQFFIHRTGHGLGIDAHEKPFISSTSNDIIENGQVFTIEPGLYFPGKFGIRLEVDVVIKEGKPHIIGDFPLDIVII
ncbi:MAG: M24 family metallopeptidase [Fervidicoccus fontis]